MQCYSKKKRQKIPEDPPSLPSFKIQFSYCFENVGLDYASPLFYKDVVQNKIQESYKLLFTRTVNRAIHLELTNNLGIEPLKLTVRRFISRRGNPSCFISDNFKTFMEIKRFNTLSQYTGGDCSTHRGKCQIFKNFPCCERVDFPPGRHRNPLRMI